MKICENQIEVIRGSGINHSHIVYDILEMEDLNLKLTNRLYNNDLVYKNGREYIVKKVLKIENNIYSANLEAIY